MEVEKCEQVHSDYKSNNSYYQSREKTHGVKQGLNLKAAIIIVYLWEFTSLVSEVFLKLRRFKNTVWRMMAQSSISMQSVLSN